MAKSYPETIPAHYASADTRRAYELGWSHGHGIACYNVPELGKRYWTDAEGYFYAGSDNVREAHAALCHAAADNARSYSPFEFTAHEFNSAGEWESLALWDAFDAGTADAIAADLAEYTDDDYGLDAPSPPRAATRRAS